jgi:hemerythrin-like domain-containing protein
MDPIETLMTEHRDIERVIDALVGFVDELRRKEATEKEELSRFVEFIRGFADGCHHGKEEDILFESMVRHGFPRQGGPVAVMLHEHDEGRAFVRALAAHAEQGGPWSAADRQAIAEAAYGYAGLLRQHIQKEDAILYPMAEQRLPPEELDRIADLCARFEEEKTGSGEHERYHALGDALVRRYAAASHPAPTPHGPGCCG